MREQTKYLRWRYDLAQSWFSLYPIASARSYLAGVALVWRTALWHPFRRDTVTALASLCPRQSGQSFDLLLLWLRCLRFTIYLFDGYDNGPTTKDCTHQRRGHGCGPAVLFDPDMLVTLKKDEFLSNQVNKQKFINLLSENLEHAGYSTRHAKGESNARLHVECAKVKAASTQVHQISIWD